MKQKTANPRRIILNVVTTYGRSIVSLFAGLFSTRWILAALGQSDFGLYGVVGSVIFFISVFNTVQSGAVARFYAFAIGEDLSAPNANIVSASAVEKWFNTALSIHICLPMIFITIGYPVGVYAFGHWLNIPPERLDACIWVFRLSLVSVFFSMISVPYVALFTAYQYISELALWTLVKVLLLFVGAYFLMFVNGDRLLWYAGMMMAVPVLVDLILIWRARRQFRGCVINFRNMFSWTLIKKMLLFTWFKFLGGIAWGVRGYGAAFMTNIYFNTAANASLSVANQLSAQAASFSNTMANAFSPAITTAEGAGNREEAVELSLRCCKFCALLVLFFGVPLILELENWLVIWLKNPPEFASGICACMVVAFLLDYLTFGQQLLICAHGRIGKWQIADAFSYLMTLPIGWVCIAMGGGLISIGYAYLIAIALTSFFRVHFAKRLAGLSMTRWIKKVVLPLFVAISIVLPASLVPLCFWEVGLGRFLITCAVSSVTMMVVGWWLVFDHLERKYVRDRVCVALGKMRAKSTGSRRSVL